MTQARLVRKLEARVCEAGQTLETVKSQEKVITKLEGLLKQASQERRAAVATAEKLQQQLVSLGSQLDTSAAQVTITALLAIYLLPRLSKSCLLSESVSGSCTSQLSHIFCFSCHGNDFYFSQPLRKLP